jgi:ATP-dependent RNA helicase SUPV3L1/SUV3
VAADSGAYCGPLRLLANEMYERMSAPDAPFSRVCSLLTGQQLIQPAGATHACCTIEMLSLNPSHDIVVIDEIQMIRDESRGWAWTRALLGSPAREVHVCGDPAAEPLVRALLKACGEELEVKRYERLSPLTIDGHSAVPNVHHLRAGDCVIAFSRKKLYTLKSEIERVGHKCCIVYGSLPPHARQEQARLFNDPKSGYDVLVATDAIGMGLNLNIGRVIFTTLSKFDGKSIAPIDAMDIRQIAGRAGRFGTQYANGQSLVLGKQRMAVELSRQFHSPVIPVEKAGIFPADDVMIAFVSPTCRLGVCVTLPRLYDGNACVRVLTHFF